MSGPIPELAVVIPTLGRNTLPRTIRSLLESAGDHHVEILVVGVLRDEAVASEVGAIVAGTPAVRLLPEVFKDGDSSRKKNAGFEASTAPIVAFVDDDVKVAEAWVDRILDAFTDQTVGMVSGPSLVPDDLPLVAQLAGDTLASWGAAYVAGRYLVGSGNARDAKWSHVIGCNMAFRREVLAQVGLFDPRFWPGEEMVASFKVEQAGHRIIFAPAAFLEHYPRGSIAGFARQVYGYGATRIRLVREGLDVEPLTLAPGLGLLITIVALLVGMFWSPVCVLLAVGTALYGLFAIVAALAKTISTRRPVDLLLVFSVPLMHLSYSLGEWHECFQGGRDIGLPADCCQR